MACILLIKFFKKQLHISQRGKSIKIYLEIFKNRIQHRTCQKHYRSYFFWPCHLLQAQALVSSEPPLPGDAASLTRTHADTADQRRQACSSVLSSGQRHLYGRRLLAPASRGQGPPPICAALVARVKLRGNRRHFHSF